MSRLHVSALLALGALLGCTERYSGGFETSDLQATVVRPTGTPVAAARVWLVKATNDSMPAAALDSTLTDSTGTARFTVVRGVDRTGLGLDAQIGDSLGISIRSLERSDLATIQLVPAFRVQVGGDSATVDTFHTIGLHIPGSHFASRSTGGTASLLVPQGTWDIAIRQGSSIEFKESLAITKDSALPLVAPLDTTKPADTATRSVDTLADGPDIALDSFRIGGIVQYVDTGFHSNGSWLESPNAYSRQIENDSIGLRLNSNWVDSASLQGSSRLMSPLLRDTGTLAIQLAFSGGIDTSLVCRMRLFDSTTGANIRVIVGSDLDSIGAYLNQYPRPPSFVPVDASRFASDNTWYFSWTRDSVMVRSSNGLLGRINIPNRFSGSARFTIEAFAKRRPSTATMWIRKTRLYKPR